jgi:hypothetical protein
MAVVSGLLAALLAFSAVRKLSHAPDVVESYARAGVREEWLNPLAIVLIAAATGLVAGLFWRPLGIATAGALVVYFLVACSFHVRNGDVAHLPTPVLMLALAVAAVALQAT